MKIENKVIFLSIIFGAVFILVDTILDYFVFYKGNGFLQLLFLKVPTHEIYTRALILACFIAFGFILAKRIQRSKLAEREAKYRTLFETSTDAIFLETLEGRVLDCNESACKMYGYRRDELIGLNAADLVPLEVAETIPDIIERELSEGGISIEAQGIRKDGSVFPTEVTTRLIEIADEKLVLVYVKDITARKQAERNIEHLNLVLRAVRDVEQLITREKDLKKMLNNVCEILVQNRGYNSAWICLLDESGECIDTAHAGIGDEFFPIREKMLRGQFVPCCIESLKTSDIFIIREPNTVCAGCPGNYINPERKSMSIRLEYRNRVFGVLTVSIPEVFGEETEEQSLFRGIAQDIAYAMHSIELEKQRDRAVKELMESEEKFRMLSEQALMGIMIIQDNRIKYINQTAADLVEASREEILKLERNPMEQMVLPEHREFVFSKLDERQRGHTEPHQYSFMVRTKKGSVRWVELYSKGVIYQEKPADLMVGIDITERKQAEEDREKLNRQLLEKNKELEQLVFIASHDLRTPLVNIQGFSRELEKDCKSIFAILNELDIPPKAQEKLTPLVEEDVPESLKYILSSATSMDTLIAGLLKVSRIGRVTLNFTRLDMNQIMSAVIDEHEYLIQDTGAMVEVDELPLCQGDEPRIIQVFSNLLDNAIKYLHPQRKGLIRITGSEEEGKVLYCVSDNGIGIAKENVEEIFKIFHRINPDVSPGEGLGLTIVRKILDLHSGEIKVESTLGKGSRFCVTLPKV